MCVEWAGGNGRAVHSPSHSQLQGFPALRSRPQWGIRVLGAVDPDNPAVLRAFGGREAAAVGLASPLTSVEVDWGPASDEGGREGAELVLWRLPGLEVVASASGSWGVPLCLSFEASPPCSAFLAQLVVEGQRGPLLRRHLHLHAPPAQRNLSNMTFTVDPDGESDSPVIRITAGTSPFVELVASSLCP